MAELQQALAEIAIKAKRLMAKSEQVGEENTKAVLIEPILQALGWNTHDLDEVRREFRYKSVENPVDYALFVSARPRLFLEAKSLGHDLGQHKWKTQAVNYANTSGVDWCVLTDGNFWQVYKSNASGDLEQKLFLETWLYSPEGRTPPYEPHYVLSLLARENLTDNAIEALWQMLSVDRQGRKALLSLIAEKDSRLVRLIRSRSELSSKEVDAFLSRAAISVETPPVTVTGPAAGQPPAKQKAVSTAGNASDALRIQGKRVTARGRLTSGGFTVLARSQVVLEIAPSLSAGYSKLRAQLIEEGVLVRAGDHLEFAQDYTFPTPSQAAAVVLGRSANGWEAWQDEQGRPLKQLQKRPQDEAEPTSGE